MAPLRAEGDPCFDWLLPDTMGTLEGQDCQRREQQRRSRLYIVCTCSLPPMLHGTEHFISNAEYPGFDCVCPEPSPTNGAFPSPSLPSPSIHPSLPPYLPTSSPPSSCISAPHLLSASCAISCRAPWLWLSSPFTKRCGRLPHLAHRISCAFVGNL